MTYGIARVLPVIILLSLLGTGTAEAFCFLKNKERRADFTGYPMPAIGFSPATYRDYANALPQSGWYGGNRSALPQPSLPYDNRYDTGSVLRR